MQLLNSLRQRDLVRCTNPRLSRPNNSPVRIRYIICRTGRAHATETRCGRWTYRRAGGGLMRRRNQDALPPCFRSNSERPP